MGDHRCIFHVFCQVKRYTTSRPNTQAGVELYSLAKNLLKIENKEAGRWIEHFMTWIKRHQVFLDEITIDEHGNKRPNHERLLKAERSLLKLIRENTLFTYLDEAMHSFSAPSMNNRIEGRVNARLREMLRNHRGLSIERRIKVMPTDQSITAIYQRMNEKHRLEKTLSIWGDAIVWSDLHKKDKTFVEWD